MASKLDFDLSLPKTAPNTDRHRATCGEALKQAVYTLVPLEKSKLDELVNKLNSADDIEPNTCGLAPKFDVAASPAPSLKKIYDYHLELRDQDHSFHPLYFIVAVSADWAKEGVVVVHLDTGLDEEEDRIDVSRCSVNDAVSWGLNLDIGNMAWDELKEWEEGEWGDKAIGAKDEDDDE
ncbi:hypothetical protein M426DRAFT_228172 [Hypoxylon sp. CI-4A]|nr:hypothetical protein M426DRAFT_228172 [Hypoxylon sp. CI-4A]